MSKESVVLELLRILMLELIEDITSRILFFIIKDIQLDMIRNYVEHVGLLEPSHISFLKNVGNLIVGSHCYYFNKNMHKVLLIKEREDKPYGLIGGKIEMSNYTTERMTTTPQKTHENNFSVRQTNYMGFEEFWYTINMKYESIAMAAEREFEEETGVSIDNGMAGYESTLSDDEFYCSSSITIDNNFQFNIALCFYTPMRICTRMYNKLLKKTNIKCFSLYEKNKDVHPYVYRVYNDLISFKFRRYAFSGTFNFFDTYPGKLSDIKFHFFPLTDLPRRAFDKPVNDYYLYTNFSDIFFSVQEMEDLRYNRMRGSVRYSSVAYVLGDSGVDSEQSSSSLEM